MMSFRKMSAYIAQDFVMLNFLTTEETLRVSVDLKMPRSTTLAEKQKTVSCISAFQENPINRYIIYR